MLVYALLQPLKRHSGVATTPPPDSPNALQIVANIVHIALQDCARKHNATTPRVSCLPTETLTTVFALLPFQDLISSTHVCHSWRTTAVECSTLWSSIVVDGRMPDVVEQLLERTRSAPVDVLGISLDYTNHRRVILSLAQHMPHIRTLVLHFGDAVNTTWFENNVLSRPAPLLAKLALHSDRKHVFSPREFLFAGIAPRLTDVEIDCYCMDLAGERALSNLRHLSYHCHTLRMKFWKDVFVICQELETLAVHMETFSTRDMCSWVEADRSPPTVPPKTLRRLSVTAGEPAGFAALDYIVHADIPDIRIILEDLLGTHEARSLVSILAPAPPTSLELDCDFLLYSIRLVDSSARVRSISHLAWKPLQSYGLGEQMLRGLTSLTIKGISLAHQLAIPRLPALTLLEIDAGLYFRDMPSLSTGEGIVECPALETLCLFTTGRDGYSPSLDRLELPKILRAIMRPPHKLKVLALRNVYLYTGSEGLGELAEQVRNDRDFRTPDNM